MAHFKNSKSVAALPPNTPSEETTALDEIFAAAMKADFAYIASITEAESAVVATASIPKTISKTIPKISSKATTQTAAVSAQKAPAALDVKTSAASVQKTTAPKTSAASVQKTTLNDAKDEKLEVVQKSGSRAIIKKTGLNVGKKIRRWLYPPISKQLEISGITRFKKDAAFDATWEFSECVKVNPEEDAGFVYMSRIYSPKLKRALYKPGYTDCRGEKTIAPGGPRPFWKRISEHERDYKTDLQHNREQIIPIIVCKTPDARALEQKIMSYEKNKANGVRTGKSKKGCHKELYHITFESFNDLLSLFVELAGPSAIIWVSAAYTIDAMNNEKYVRNGIERSLSK